MRFQSCCVALIASSSLSNSLRLPAPNAGGQTPLAESFSLAQDEETIKLALGAAKVIPDVLDDFDIRFAIKPYYAKSDKSVSLGNKLKPKAVKHIPDLYMNGVPPAVTCNSNTVYSLVLTDPDALSHDNPVKAQMCHWIITNITVPSPDHSAVNSFDLRSALTSSEKGKSGKDGLFELVSYFPPAPPPKTGYHRYVFALLASEPDAVSPIPKKPKDRPHWGYGKVGAGIREWALENNLTIVAANFFYAENKKQ